jgi:hypothetical protein
MVKEELVWRPFTLLVVSVVRKKPDPHPDTGRLWVGFVPKEGTETSSQKGHVVFPFGFGKSLTERRTEILKSCSAQHQNTVTETAYPFTLDWNDWTNNMVGLSNQGPTINHRLRLGNQALLDFDNRAVAALTEFGLVEARKAPIHPESHFPSKTFVVGLEPRKLTLFVKKSRNH